MRIAVGITCKVWTVSHRSDARVEVAEINTFYVEDIIRGTYDTMKFGDRA